MPNTSQGVRICLSRDVDGDTIQVWIDDENEFSNGYAMLQRLCNQAKIERLKSQYERYISREGEHLIISEAVSEGPFIVALSLLMAYPDCKRSGEIQDETNLASGSVSNILVGRQGNLGSWFMRCNEGWKLSNEGIARIKDGELRIEE